MNNLQPHGIMKAHIDGIVPSLSIITFKETGKTGLYEKYREMNNSYSSLYGEMIMDKSRDPASKTEILARKAKQDIKAAKSELTTVIETTKNSSDRIIMSAKDPVNTAKTQETRAILRNRNVSKSDIINLAENNPVVLDAVLTSPLPEMDYGFSKKELNELTTLQIEQSIGEERMEELRENSKIIKAASVALESIEKKLGHIIEVDAKNKYHTEVA